MYNLHLAVEKNSEKANDSHNSHFCFQIKRLNFSVYIIVAVDINICFGMLVCKNDQFVEKEEAIFYILNAGFSSVVMPVEVFDL